MYSFFFKTGIHLFLLETPALVNSAASVPGQARLAGVKWSILAGRARDFARLSAKTLLDTTDFLYPLAFL
jgi:hypothetical protein